MEVGKGLPSLVVPVDDRDDSKTMLWASDVDVGESALHAGSVRVMTVIERGGSRP